MAKHIIEENIKTIGGQSIVGKGNITIEGKEVKTDNKTISLNENGEIQLGAGDELAIDREYLHIKTNMIGIEDQYGSMSYLTNNLLSINDGETGSQVEIRPSIVSFYDEDRNVSHTFYIPKNTTNNSVIPVTVNGVYADEKGNITIPSEEGKTDNKTISKNKDGELQIGVFNENLGANIVDGIVNSNQGFNVDNGNGHTAFMTPESFGTIFSPNSGQDYANFYAGYQGFSFGSYFQGGNASNSNVFITKEGISYSKTNESNEELNIEGEMLYPDLSGESKVMTASVNGIFADRNGNITLPSSSIEVDGVTLTKNLEGKIQVGNGNAFYYQGFARFAPKTAMSTTVETTINPETGISLKLGNQIHDFADITPNSGFCIKKSNSDKTHYLDGKISTSEFVSGSGVVFREYRLPKFNVVNSTYRTFAITLDGKSANENGEFLTGYDTRLTALENRADVKADNKSLSRNKITGEFKLGVDTSMGNMTRHVIVLDDNGYVFGGRLPETYGVGTAFFVNKNMFAVNVTDRTGTVHNDLRIDSNRVELKNTFETEITSLILDEGKGILHGSKSLELTTTTGYKQKTGIKVNATSINIFSELFTNDKELNGRVCTIEYMMEKFNELENKITALKRRIEVLEQ